MAFTINTYAKQFNAILLVILTGCSAPRPVIVNDNFPALAQELLSFGIQQISERYIDPVRVSDLAIEGLRGLESIDASFEVEVAPANIVIGSDQIEDQIFFKPLTDNAEEWARMMVDTLEYCRAHSPLIRAAGEEKLICPPGRGVIPLAWYVALLTSTAL